MNTAARRCLALAMLVLLCSCKNAQKSTNQETELSNRRKIKEERELAPPSTQVSSKPYEYPQSIPFPQFPDSKIKFSMPPAIEKTTITVSLETLQKKGKVISFYKEWFKKNGWKVDSETSTSGLDSLTAQSNKKSASIMAMPDLDKTTIQIIMSTES